MNKVQHDIYNCIINTVTVPISTIENKLSKTPYGIRLQTGDIGKFH